jgi:RimJ/RimL family protein N-acetyltransferase
VNQAEFIDFHAAALELDEFRHSLILSILGRTPPGDVRFWTLGAPGQCAVQTPGYPILLGALSREQCESFAEQTRDMDYPGVVGADETAVWFTERAEALGLSFPEKIPQAIKAVRAAPFTPEVPGFARRAGPEDFEAIKAWTLAFAEEAVPHDPAPNEESIRRMLAQGRHRLWMVGDNPVSMAAIARRTKNTASINSVYTPREHRNKGFAAAVTAALAQELFAEGRKAVCLYTDLRNPASNRCYEKLGFEIVCISWHMIRVMPKRSAGS